MIVRYDRTTTRQGLDVIVIQTVDRVEAAAVQLTLDAGTLDEHPSEGGLAHLVEHMLFKGSAHHPVGAATARIEAHGGDLNAWTSHDQLTLHTALDAAAWPEAIDVIADLLTRPLLPADELERERSVVLDELAGYDDDPESLVSDRVQAALWGTHPYGRRVLGTRKTVPQHDVEALRAWMNRELGPQRAHLCVVGPAQHVSLERVVARAEAAFEGWAPTAPRRPPLPAPPLRPGTIARGPESFDSRTIELAWRAPPAGHPDGPALDVLAHLLGQAAGARLATLLQHDEHLAFGVWADHQPGQHGSSFSIGFVPVGRHGRRAIATTLDALEDLVHRPPGPDVERSRAMLVADTLWTTETVEGIAEQVVELATHGSDPADLGRVRRELQAVTVEDVVRVARTWLSRDRVVVGLIDPDTSDAALRRLLRPLPPLPKVPPEVRFEIDGVPIVVQYEDAPTVSVHIVASGGDLLARGPEAGLGAAWARMATAGAAGMDAAALGEQLDALTADVEAWSGRQSAGYSLSVPVSHFPEAADLLGDLLLEPSFDAEEWARTQVELLDDLETQADRPEEQLLDLSRKVRWAGHPWSHPALGTTASLGALETAALAAYHDRHFARGAPAGLAIAVVGGVRPEDVERSLSWLGDLPDGRGPLSKRPRPLPTLSGRHDLVGGRRQVHLGWVGAGFATDDPRRVPLALAVCLLDGQGGRLFHELRERLGLAYEIWASSSAGLDGGTLRVGAATDPARADAAAAALRAALEDLASRPPSPEEHARACRMVLGRAALDAQRAASRAASLASRALFGVPLTRPELARAVHATDGAAVAQAVRDVLNGGLAELRVAPAP